MAEDFKISIGVNGEGKGTQGTKSVENSTTFGVSKGLKMAGVVGILSQIKIVMDIVGVAAQMMSVGIVSVVGLLGGLLGLFISKVVTFFEDPTRHLLQFGLFIVNGIIGGLEMGLNMVVAAINLVVRGLNALIPFGNPISEMDKFELPRFQSEMVLNAYDDYRKTITELSDEAREDGRESINAQIKFMQDLGKSFMKNSEYQEILEERALESQQKTSSGIDSVSNLADALQVGSSTSVVNFSSAFDTLDSLANELKKRSEQTIRRLGGSSGGGSSSFSQSQANIDYGNQTMQSTTLTQKQAESGLYLLDKLGM